MSNSRTDAQSNQCTPKILYVEDQLAQNIPRLLRLFKEYIGETDQKRLQELELDSYTDPEKIKQVFNDIQSIDVEYKFPEALSKIQKDSEQYNLFIIDRNLAEAEYRVEEVQKIDSQYSQEICTRFSQREGDYILFKLAIIKKVDVLNKFYFLTAYSAQSEIRSAPEIKKILMDFGAFQKKNFIEKGNKAHLMRLLDVIKNSLMPTGYVFNLKDGSTIKGDFVSPVINIQTGNGKISLNTDQLVNVTSVGRVPQLEFIIELKSGDTIQGRFVDKKITANTQINPNHTIIIQNIQSIKLV